MQVKFTGVQQSGFKPKQNMSPSKTLTYKKKNKKTKKKNFGVTTID
jgi:hypothetical protein